MWPTVAMTVIAPGTEAAVGQRAPMAGVTNVALFGCHQQQRRPVPAGGLRAGTQLGQQAGAQYHHIGGCSFFDAGGSSI